MLAPRETTAPALEDVTLRPLSREELALIAHEGWQEPTPGAIAHWLLCVPVAVALVAVAGQPAPQDATARLALVQGWPAVTVMLLRDRLAVLDLTVEGDS